MMKYKVLTIFWVFLMILSGRTNYASISECYEEACEIPAASSSQFFLEDANDLDALEDEDSPIPTLGQFWPVEGVITGRFGMWRGRRHRGHYHAGVDIAAPKGTSIVAPLEGTVTFVGRKGGYGLTVLIDHGKGVSTLYAHQSQVMISEGDTVKKGQVISKVGNSGRSTGPHLHYEVRFEGRAVNPLAWTEKLQAKIS